MIHKDRKNGRGKNSGQEISRRLWKRGSRQRSIHLLSGFPGGSANEESACSVEELGLIPGLGRSLGEGIGYPLQYSGLENFMDCIVHGVTKSQTQLSDFHFTPHYFADKGLYSQSYHFSSSHVWMENWTIKKAECQRTDAFELWCWRRLLRVPWTTRRSNQLFLKEINPKYSLEGLMMKLKLQYFGHLMQRTGIVSR